MLIFGKVASSLYLCEIYIYKMKNSIPLALTFDDVLLVPAYSEVLPRDVDVSTFVTSEIRLSIPVLSAAMDTVTESSLAIAMAQAGGLGIIHKNMPIDRQCYEIGLVKTAAPEGNLASRDSSGRLLVGAAVGIKADTQDKIEMLVRAGADVIVIDTAHGHSAGVLRAISEICRKFGKNDVQIIAGNVATAEGARALAKAGVHAVKVGIGPGSICTTRVVAGVGMPQLTAIMLAAKELKRKGIPVIADGGIRYSGDVVKALAAGASAIMAGSLLAGTEEAPGQIIEEDDRKYKVYRGMGSLDAMACGSKDRYFQDMEDDVKKLVPEGVVARVPYKGPVAGVLYQLIGGLRSGMGYVGAKDIKALRGAEFVRISNAGFLEGHPHDVTITKEAPNYRR